MARGSAFWPSGWGAVVVIAAVTVLAGCAGQPKGVLTPVVAGAPQTESVEMIVATMRDPTDVPGEMFSGERGLQPAFATITVSIPPPGVHAVGAVEWPKKLPPDPAKEFAVLQAEQIEREAARAWFHDRVAKAPGRSTLIFVHGFNNRFEDAVFRFAQIAHDSDMQAVPVLFTWPSRGSMLAYGYDRESTNYSRDALELLLQVLARDPYGRRGVDPRPFDGQLGDDGSAAADGDPQRAHRAEDPQRDDGGAGPGRRRLPRADRADGHAASELYALRFAGRPGARRVAPRLGRRCPPRRHRSGDGTVQDGACELPDTGHRSHQAQGGTTARTTPSSPNLPEIVQLIGTRLASGQTITDTHVGLGEQIIQATTGMTATVGAAAGLVIAAPVAIVDPNTRENYGKHVGGLGAAMAGHPQTARRRRSGVLRRPPPARGASAFRSTNRNRTCLRTTHINPETPIGSPSGGAP